MLTADEGFRQELYQVCLLVGTQHQVNTFYLTHEIRLQLRIASSDHHKGMRMLAHHAVYSLTTLMISNLGHRACVNQADIGMLPLGGSLHSHFLQHLRKG